MPKRITTSSATPVMVGASGTTVEDATLPHAWNPVTTNLSGAWRNACGLPGCSWGQSRSGHANAAQAFAARASEEAQHNLVLAGLPVSTAGTA